MSDIGQSVVDGGVDTHVGMKFQGRPLHVEVPNLNKVVLPKVDMHDYTERESRAILPFVRPLTDGFSRGVEFEINQIRELEVVSKSLPLMLFGSELMTQCNHLGDCQEKNNQIVVSGIGGSLHDQGDLVSGRVHSVQQVELALSLGSDPFNLDHSIFGTRDLTGKKLKRRPRRMTGSRRVIHPQFVPPELDKRVNREMDYVGGSHATKRRTAVNFINDQPAKVDGAQPRQV